MKTDSMGFNKALEDYTNALTRCRNAMNPAERESWAAVALAAAKMAEACK